MDLALFDADEGADAQQAACNRCNVAIPPEGDAIATPCAHLFCVPCATASFDATTQRGACALCQTPLHAKDARRVRPHQPAGNLKVRWVWWCVGFVGFLQGRGGRVGEKAMGRVVDAAFPPNRSLGRPGLRSRNAQLT